MANYQDVRFSLDFTYAEWIQILRSIEQKREGIHRHADMLELQETGIEQVPGLRRKAAELLTLIEKVSHEAARARADARVSTLEGRTA